MRILTLAKSPAFDFLSGSPRLNFALGLVEYRLSVIEKKPMWT